MKSLLLSLLVFTIGLNVTGTPKISHSLFKEISVKVLQSQPESYKNKKVCYVTTYQKFMTTFPAYAARNGFKEGKYYWLLIQPLNLPVIAKKTKDMNSIVPLLKARSKVKVYGKIKKFKVRPKISMLPSYYLELIDIEVLKEPKKRPASSEANEDTKLPPLKRIRRKLRHLPVY